MTKKIIAASLLILSCIAACKKGDFLDKTATSDLTEQSVFSDSTRTMQFLTGIYADIGFSFNPFRFNGAGLEAASDEAEGPASNISSSAYLQWAGASVNAASVNGDAWYVAYANIRRVNVFFKNLPRSPLTAALKKTARAEARFLRTWYYFNLLKHYGGVPLVGDTIYNDNAPIDVVRNSFEECVNYIVSECDAVTPDLPATQFAVNFGRITSGAALALKAKVLLYAASPLFNGEQIATAEPERSLTGYPSADPQRWRKAADAAKAVIDLNRYKLNEDNTAPGYGFYKVFTLRKNDEYILQQMRPANRELEGMWLPPSRSAFDGSNPYLEMAEAFPMRNGKAITDPSSGYDPANPYANRDPRFNYTIIHNESMIWINSGPKQPVYTYVGYPQDGIYTGTPTGFYINKMLQDDIVPNNFGQTQRCFPLIRYAEILLDYAEALNEIDGPVQAVYDAMEAIRKRAGLDPYQLPAGLTKAQMRDAIRNERRIELAFEEQRFWDVRRWKIAEQTDNKPMHGQQVTKNGGTYSYETVVVRPHVFRPAMYLWPLPQGELSKSPDLIQNTGW